MTKVKCVNCGEIHPVDSIDGQPEDKRAKIRYTCPENDVGYEAYRLVDRLEDVTQQGDEFIA